jgi:hypothetical protein
LLAPQDQDLTSITPEPAGVLQLKLDAVRVIAPPLGLAAQAWLALPRQKVATKAMVKPLKFFLSINVPRARELTRIAPDFPSDIVLPP